VIVCGHTHKPYDKVVGSARFINDGSAGKPKDGDPRACWALLDTATGALDLRRVEYDVEKTAQAILASDLPHEFAAQVREARGYAPMPAVAG
jgi:diadenosine tetraphosphatase ApaH/serine/threonine PP2A family protein phosphatase